MNTKNLLTMAAFAAGTATVTVTTFLAGALVAEPEQTQQMSSIDQPKLVAEGIELSAALANEQGFVGGDQLAFELTAVNTLGETADAVVRLAIYGSTPVSPLSRAMPMPILLWQEDRRLTLQQNEHKRIRLTPPVSLPTNSIISIALSEVKDGNDDKALPFGDSTVQSAHIPVSIDGVVVLNFSTMSSRQDLAFTTLVQGG